MEPCYKDRCFRFINRSAITIATFSAMYFAESSMLAGNFSESVRYEKTKDHPTLYYKENYDQFLSNDSEFVQTKPLQVLYFMYNEHFGMHDGQFNCNVDFFDYENMSDQTCFNLIVGSYPEAFLDIALLHKRGMFKITKIRTYALLVNITNDLGPLLRFISRIMKNIALVSNDKTDRDLVVLNNLLFSCFRCKDYDFHEKFSSFLNIDYREIRYTEELLVYIVNSDEIFSFDDALLALCNDDINTLQLILSKPGCSGRSNYSLNVYKYDNLYLEYTDLAALSGAIECFRYLILTFNEINPTGFSMNMALIGGNTDIIHTLQDNLGNDYDTYIIGQCGIKGISDCEILKWAINNRIALPYDLYFANSITYYFPNLKAFKTLFETSLFSGRDLGHALGTTASRFFQKITDLPPYEYLLKFLTSNANAKTLEYDFNTLYYKVKKEERNNQGNPVFNLLKKYGIDIHSSETLAYNTWLQFLKQSRKG